MELGRRGEHVLSTSMEMRAGRDLGRDLVTVPGTVHPSSTCTVMCVRVSC